MSIRQYFSYLKNRVLYPELADFLDMGLGIEARHARCKSFWEKHIECCRSFQRRWTETLPKGIAACVLGAGRLYDIETDILLTKCSSLTLVDADPSVITAWDRFASEAPPKVMITSSVEDITGSMKAWTFKLEEFVKGTRNARNEEDAVRFLDNLEVEPGIALGRFDLILSMNVLSQIPIYWRERVHKIFSRVWKLETDDDGNYGHGLKEALERSQQRLEAQHRTLLEESGAPIILLSTDRFFHYYKKDAALWKTEDALIGGASFDLRNYDLAERDSWLWHIAPQDIEQEGYGIIHEVVAHAFRRPQ